MKSAFYFIEFSFSVTNFRNVVTFHIPGVKCDFYVIKGQKFMLHEKSTAGMFIKKGLKFVQKSVILILFCSYSQSLEMPNTFHPHPHPPPHGSTCK